MHLVVAFSCLPKKKKNLWEFDFDCVELISHLWENEQLNSVFSNVVNCVLPVSILLLLGV